MREAIKLIEKWIENDSIVFKDIKIENEKIFTEVKNKEGATLRISVYIGKLKNGYEEDFLNLINKLTKYHVKSDNPF